MEANGQPDPTPRSGPIVHLIRRWNFVDELPVCGAQHAAYGDRTVYRESVTCPECRVHPAMESALCQDTGKTALAGEASAEPPIKVDIFDETSKWFLIPGRNGAKGLYVAVNPAGAVGIRPVDDAVGTGWGLYAEAAADLRSILDANRPSTGATPADLTVDVSMLREEGWFALAGDFETAATEGGAAQGGEEE